MASMSQTFMQSEHGHLCMTKALFIVSLYADVAVPVSYYCGETIRYLLGIISGNRIILQLSGELLPRE